MNPFISDDRLMRSQLEDRLRRAEDARLAEAVRRAKRIRSFKPATEASGSGSQLGPEAFWRLALATPTLRDQGMPPGEVDAILEADDPEVIRRYLELHRERLEERFAAQRRTVGHLMQAVTSTTRDRRRSARRKRGGMRLVSLTSDEGTR